MKATIKATELKDATAEYISLVERGANRIPFKITKSDKSNQESQMVNLEKVLKAGTTQAAAASAVTVVGLVVQKGKSLKAAADAIKSCGFSIEKTEDADGGNTVIYKQEDAIDWDKTLVVKMSDNMLVILKGAAEGAVNADAIKAHGFLPSVDMAYKGLVKNVAEAVESGKDVTTKVEASINDFGNFVLDTAKLVPAAAFKAAQLVDKAQAGAADNHGPANDVRTSGPEMADGTIGEDAQGVGAAKAKETPANQGDVETDQGPDVKLKNGPDAGKPGSGQPPQGVQVANQRPADGDVAPGLMTKADEKFAGQLSEITKTLGLLTEAVSGVVKSVEQVNGRVAKVEATATEAQATAVTVQKKVTGTIIGGDAGGDRAPTQKSEASAAGNIDTAFDRKVRKAALGTAGLNVTKSA